MTTLRAEHEVWNVLASLMYICAAAAGKTEDFAAAHTPFFCVLVVTTLTTIDTFTATGCCFHLNASSV